MSKLTQKKTRNPSRTKQLGSVSVSVSWGVFDRLDTLATAENASIGRVIEGLLTEHEKRQEPQP